MVDNSGLIGGGGLETTVSLEAGENMSVGDNWFLGVDGKAYKLRDYFTGINFASLYPTENSSGNYSLLRLYLDSASNKMVAVVRDNDTNDIYAGIITVNPTSGALTIGALTDLSINLTGSSFTFMPVGTNKLLVTNTGSGTMTSFVLNYSTTTPVAGATGTVSPTNFSGLVRGFDYDSVNDKVIMIYKQNIAPYYIRCNVGTISGNSITWNTTESLYGTQSWTSSLTCFTMFDSTEQKFIFVFRNYYNSSNHVNISAFIIDISGGSVSTSGYTNLLISSSASTGFFDSNYGAKKLSNGNYLACGYFDVPNGKAYVDVVKLTPGGTAITNIRTELRDNGSNIVFYDSCPIVNVGSAGKFLIGIMQGSIDYLYYLQYNGTTLSDPELIYSANVNVFINNISNPTGELVLHNITRTVGSDTYNTIQVFDFAVNTEVQGYYDFGNSGTMPYIPGGYLQNREEDAIIAANGVSFYIPNVSGIPCLTMDNGKIIFITPYGVVKETMVSGTTYKMPVKAVKQGGKPIPITGQNLRPPSSYYMSGESINWYASTNNDTAFDSEYIGYCLTDDNLVINSNASKET